MQAANCFLAAQGRYKSAFIVTSETEAPKMAPEGSFDLRLKRQKRNDGHRTPQLERKKAFGTAVLICRTVYPLGIDVVGEMRVELAANSGCWREYTLFRKALLRDGFTQMQYSVYARHCPSKENAEVHVARIERHLPPDGEVRVVTITDKQFERMQIFWGKIRKPPEPALCQLTLF